MSLMFNSWSKYVLIACIHLHCFPFWQSVELNISEGRHQQCCHHHVIWKKKCIECQILISHLNTYILRTRKKVHFRFRRILESPNWKGRYVHSRQLLNFQYLVILSTIFIFYIYVRFTNYSCLARMIVVIRCQFKDFTKSIVSVWSVEKISSYEL